MSRTSKSKKNKLIPIILLVAVAVFAYMSLYKGEVVIKKTASSNIIQKLTKEVLVNGGEFEITQEDLNGLINLYFKSPMSNGDITIKEVNTEMVDGKILIEVPFSYKKIDLLFSSTGKLNVLDGEITYAADNFKIGKIILSKKFVMSQISKLKNKDAFYVEGDLVKIKTGKVTLKINSLQIKDDKILGTVGFKGIKASSEDKTSKANIDTTSEDDIDNQLATAKLKIQKATTYMNTTQKNQAKEILSTIEEVKNKSVEEKKQVLNNTNNIINKATN